MLETKDVMTKQVICIERDTPIVEAIRLMATNHVTGIPVVQDDMTLVGILSEQHILRLFNTFFGSQKKVPHRQPVNDYNHTRLLKQHTNLPNHAGLLCFGLTLSRAQSTVFCS
ncbi:MAG: CBS domain-containing protein [Planctomycetota bacterium]|jgi:CBS-domain-containing membrane protein